MKAFEKALEIGKKHGIHVGVSPADAEDVKMFYNKGARFFESVGLEGLLINELSNFRKDCEP